MDRRQLVLALALLAAVPAMAADRHVFVSSSGVLQKCANPAHNPDSPATTGNLQYCPAGTNAGRIIGNKTGYVSSCPSSTITNLPNGASVFIDGGSTLKTVYGHPQACVYNMAKSDSCEIHAGTYRAAGFENASDVGHNTGGTCWDFNCTLGSVAAFGYGPNLNTGTGCGKEQATPGPTCGYGTAANPGWMRGAVMNSSTDTWDCDNDKIPDASDTSLACTSYAPILSGDRDNDGAFDTTSCPTGAGGGAGTCSGDSFAAVWVGCGGIINAADTIHYDFVCSPGFTSGEHGTRLDTDADGSFETEIGRQDAKNVDYFQIKDIKFTGYNAGNGSSQQGSRHREAHINLNGIEDSDGLKIDHIWMQDNADYNGAGSETFWAEIADMRNKGCADYTEIKNSLLYQHTRFLYNDDGVVSAALGCSMNIHDNRIVVQRSNGNGDTGGLWYIKSFDHHPDGRPKVMRFWNNEVILKTSDINATFIGDTQQFGNSDASSSAQDPSGNCTTLNAATGLGAIYFYGNLLRYDPSPSALPQFFYSAFCSQNCTGLTRDWTFVEFNNTFDRYSTNANGDGTDQTFGTMCSSQNNGSTYNAKKYYSKNNVWINASGEGTTPAAAPGTSTVVNQFNTDTNKCLSSSSGYFAHGAGNTCDSAPTFWTGLTYYAPRTGGALDEVTVNSPCDPDGDGTRGFDYDGNGTNDTSWVDIAGNSVDCSVATNPTGALDMGAIQNSNDGGGTGPSCGNGAREGSEVCDLTDLNSETCISRGYSGGTLACCDNTTDGTDCGTTHDCSIFDTTGCTISTTIKSTLKGVSCRGCTIQ